MQIAECLQKLITNSLNFMFLKLMPCKSFDVICKRFSLSKFCNQKDLFWRIKSFEQINDVWMFDFLENWNLSHDWFFSILICQFKFFIDLYSNSAISWVVKSKFYTSICSLTNSFLNCIWIDAVFVKEFSTIVIHFWNYLPSCLKWRLWW